jgi:hypothetical protein
MYSWKDSLNPALQKLYFRFEQIEFVIQNLIIALRGNASRVIKIK